MEVTNPSVLTNPLNDYSQGCGNTPITFSAHLWETVEYRNAKPRCPTLSLLLFAFLYAVWG
jgi:hypothetical protein